MPQSFSLMKEKGERRLKIPLATGSGDMTHVRVLSSAPSISVASVSPFDVIIPVFLAQLRVFALSLVSKHVSYQRNCHLHVVFTPYPLVGSHTFY